MPLDQRRARCKRNSVHRLDLYFHAGSHLRVAQVESIARYIQVPPRALLHSLQRFGDLSKGTFKPINFQVMTHMYIPDTGYALGIVVLPTYLVIRDERNRTQLINPVYESSLDKAVSAVARNEPLVLDKPQIPIELTYHMLTEIKYRVDKALNVPSPNEFGFKLRLKDNLCVAYYEALAKA